MPPPVASRSLLELGARLLRPGFRRSPTQVTSATSRSPEQQAPDQSTVRAQTDMSSWRRNNRQERLDQEFFTPNEAYSEDYTHTDQQHHRGASMGWAPQARSREVENSHSQQRYRADDTQTWSAEGHTPSQSRQGDQISNHWEAYHDAGSAQRRSWRKEYGYYNTPRGLEAEQNSHGYQRRELPSRPPSRWDVEPAPQPASHHDHWRTQPRHDTPPAHWQGQGQIRPPHPGRPPRPPPQISKSFGAPEQVYRPPQQKTHSTTSDWQASNSIRQVSIRSGPRKSYRRATGSTPSTFSFATGPPPTLPLLVLDLNGTLVHRGHNRVVGAQHPTRRPYLSSFLQYCLGVRDASFQHAEEGDTNLSATDVDEAAANVRRKEWLIYGPKPSDQKGPHLHGVHYQMTDPGALQSAANIASTQRLLVWSSAQPQNVDSMVQAILHPAQAAQLVRVWARDTLVPQRLYKHKSPSIKDLEVVWNALNHPSALDVRTEQSSTEAAEVHEGERRVSAEYRDRADHHLPDGSESESDSESSGMKGQGKYGSGKYVPPSRGKRPGAAFTAHTTAGHYVKKPKLTAARQWQDSRGFGSHNTLLLDDSTDKARMQPYNHLLIPEFDQERAAGARAYREKLVALHRQSQQEKAWAQASTRADKTGDGERLSPLSHQVDDLQLEGKSRRAKQRIRQRDRAALAAKQEIAESTEVDVEMDATKSASESAAGSSSDPDQGDELSPEPDTVLLQAVGVLEHARWQTNVASWIRHGGLGSFAGMEQPGADLAHQGAGKGGGKSQELKGKDAEELPLLNAKTSEKTEAFWEAEGRRALKRRGVPIIF